MSGQPDGREAGAESGPLLRLQADFQSCLLHADPAVEHWIVSTDTVPAAERLGIYQHAYFARLADVLGDDFKALAAYLGEAAFQDMARAYAKTCPSIDPSVRWFGGRLAQFLAGTAPYRGTPMLAEIAAFEWALTLAFDAADVALLTLDRMAGFPADCWGEARIQFHPSVQRFDLNHDVPGYWRSVVKDADSVSPHPQDRAASWVVWRRQTTPHYRILEPDECWAMDALRRASTFDSVCAGLCRWHEASQVPLRFASLLKGWIAEEMIAGISA